jgi:hypothetical protein
MIVLNSKRINWLVFKMLMRSVFCEVGVKSWNVTQANYFFQSVKSSIQVQYAKQEWINYS